MRGFDRSRYGKGFLMRDFFMQLQDTTPWIWTGAAACVVLVIVLLGMRVVHSLVLRATSHHTMFGLIVRRAHAPLTVVVAVAALNLVWQAAPDEMRSEEHTSELQSLMRISYAVFCLKKKKQKQ